MAKKYYTESIPDVEKELKTSLDSGLSDSDAKARLEKYGPNALASKKKQSMFMRFVDQFKDFMIIVLIIAAILSGVVANEWTDAAIIMIVVILNAILGVFQEARSEAAIEALKEMATPDAHVRRNDAIVTIPSTELVPGDIVLLEAGDVVPADLRLNMASSLKIEESALTGESVPVEKKVETLSGDDIALGDRVNMAYSNTNVTYGRGEGIVVGTGMHTEVGKIATMLNNADETDTPLKRNLNQLGKTLTIMILAICVIVFIVGVLKADPAERNSTLMINMFLVAVSLAVAAIPEGLPAIVTIILALGTQTMAKHKSIVRKLPAVETLGATDIICSDKTGTLTQNRMTVVEHQGDTAALATAYGAGPDLVYLPEVDFDMDQFLSDVERIYKEKGNCMVAVSEGIHYADGSFVSEAKTSATDGFGHAQLGGLASLLANVVKEKTGAKVRGIELSLLQRCGAHLASETDIEEAVMSGKAAVENAVAGITDKMVGFERSYENGQYVCRTKLLPLTDVANTEKKVPVEWINAAHNNVEKPFIDYVLPLIQGEPKLPKVDSLPRFAKLKKVLVK